MPINMNKGKQIVVVEGEGKGKTTYAIGLAVRNVLSGGFSAIIQFMKGYPYSEVKCLESISGITIEQTGTPYFVKKGEPSEVDLSEARRGILLAHELIEKKEHNLIILDEINVAVSFGLISLEELQELLSGFEGPGKLLLTGRYPPVEIISGSDLHITMEEVLHPFQSGIMARRGIDY